MQNNINIGNLKGIQKSIALKCDKNGDGKLENSEVSIFNQACSTISGDTYIFDGKAYNTDGSLNFIRQVPQNSILDNPNPLSNLSQVFNGNPLEQSQSTTAGQTNTPSIQPTTPDINESIPPHVEVPVSTRVDRNIIPEIKYDKPAQLGVKSDVRTKYEWSESAFNKMIEQTTPKNSVLRGRAKAFIEAGKKYGVDPRFLFGIAMCESGRGTSSRARGKNHDVGGLLGKTFSSVNDSIYKIAETINTNIKKGNTSAYSIAYPYTRCLTTYKDWRKQVTGYMQDATSKYQAAIR